MIKLMIALTADQIDIVLDALRQHERATMRCFAGGFGYLGGYAETTASKQVKATREAIETQQAGELVSHNDTNLPTATVPNSL